MNRKQTTNPPETIESILAQAVAKAQIAAATCVGVHRGSISSDETPEETSDWAPFHSRDEWQEFNTALDRCLEKQAAKQRSAA